MKATTKELTTAPLEIPPRIITAPVTPETIRLPEPGTRCPFSGMSRSALNALVLPTEANGFKPPVKSFCLRQKGAKTGIRLIDYRSLFAYIRRHEETGQPHNTTTKKG
jgi:hypothetical protein